MTNNTTNQNTINMVNTNAINQNITNMLNDNLLPEPTTLGLFTKPVLTIITEFASFLLPFHCKCCSQYLFEDQSTLSTKGKVIKFAGILMVLFGATSATYSLTGISLKIVNYYKLDKVNSNIEQAKQAIDYQESIINKCQDAINKTNSGDNNQQLEKIMCDKKIENAKLNINEQIKYIKNILIPEHNNIVNKLEGNVQLKSKNSSISDKVDFIKEAWNYENSSNNTIADYDILNHGDTAIHYDDGIIINH